MSGITLTFKLCIHILTWNVGGKTPIRSVELLDALSLNGTSNCMRGGVPDVFVIGLQEATQPFFAEFNVDVWTLWIADKLQQNTQYQRVAMEKGEDTITILYAKKTHLENIRVVQSKNTRVGLANTAGNSAITIRFSIYGIGIALVNTHLTTPDGNWALRERKFRKLLSGPSSTVVNANKILLIFWFGDFNFRIQGSWDTPALKRMVDKGHLKELYQNDQFYAMHEKGEFKAFTEGNVVFPPTCKFKEGTSDYNLEIRPAWCDRIMYHLGEDPFPEYKMKLLQRSYRSYPNYVLSAHKPVSSTFILKPGNLPEDEDDIIPQIVESKEPWWRKTFGCCRRKPKT